MAKNICMDLQKRKDLNLRLGNLILAIFVATVPTAITYGSLSLHGLNICRNLSSKVIDSSKIKETCDEAAWHTTKNYIFLIGFFITLPTWMWFYLSVKRKKNFNKWLINHLLRQEASKRELKYFLLTERSIYFFLRGGGGFNSFLVKNRVKEIRFCFENLSNKVISRKHTWT